MRALFSIARGNNRVPLQRFQPTLVRTSGAALRRMVRNHLPSHAPGLGVADLRALVNASMTAANVEFGYDAVRHACTDAFREGGVVKTYGPSGRALYRRASLVAGKE